LYSALKTFASRLESADHRLPPKDYGIHAVLSGFKLHMLRNWMSHANMATTAIYANAIGSEELEIADRMWLIHFTL